MKIALIYPPSADPTAPYLSVPILTGYLRSKGMDVLPIDANVEGYDFLLRPENLRKLAAQVDRRLARLKKEKVLDHGRQLECATLSGAQRFAHMDVPRAESARAQLKSPDTITQADAMKIGGSAGTKLLPSRGRL